MAIFVHLCVKDFQSFLLNIWIDVIVNIFLGQKILANQ